MRRLVSNSPAERSTHVTNMTPSIVGGHRRPPLPGNVFRTPTPPFSPLTKSTNRNTHRSVRLYSQWLENNADIDVDVPIEDAWSLWEDRERIPQWMPWITSVTVQKDDPRMSRWKLSTFQFNRQWEFSWLAQNLTPMKYQKIHWRSVPGSTGGSLGSLEVQNRGQIRFFKRSPTTCNVKLTISYEVPNGLAPFANLLTPVVEGILQTDMKRFAEFAVKERANK